MEDGWPGGWRGHARTVADGTGEEELAHQETKDSKPPAIKHCRGCEGRRNSQSHMTEFFGKWG